MRYALGACASSLGRRRNGAMMSTAPRLCPHCHREVRPQSRFCPIAGRAWPTAADPKPLNGGNYRIIRSLTRGGMGQVFLAEDLRAFDRPCIVKQMIEYYDPSDPEERRRAQERFEEEGRTLASLNHPGVPKIYSFLPRTAASTSSWSTSRAKTSRPYVTHIDDNGTVVRPVRRLQQGGSAACHHPGGAHPRGISTPSRGPWYTRIIKPANLILERQLGYARLVDFGTARVEIPGAAPGTGSAPASMARMAMLRRSSTRASLCPARTSLRSRRPPTTCSPMTTRAGIRSSFRASPICRTSCAPPSTPCAPIPTGASPPPSSTPRSRR